MNILSKIPIKKTVTLALTTLLILFVLFKSVAGFGQFKEVIEQADSSYLWLAFLVTLPFIPLATLRWWLVLRASGYNLPLKQLLLVVVASGPFIIIPGQVGDIVRSYPIRHQIPTTQAIATIIFEKIIDIMVLLLFAGVGFFIMKSYTYASLGLILAVSVIPTLIISKKIITALKFRMPIFQKISEAFGILEKVRDGKKMLLLAVLTSAINWFQSVLMAYYLFLSFGASVPILAIISYFPITLFAGLIPISLAGIGVREGLIISLFASYASPAKSLAMGLGYSTLGYLFPILIGLPFLVKYSIKEIRV